MPPTPARAVLLDLDGTLVDSAGDLAAALNHVLARRGRRPVTRLEVEAMVGDGARTLVQRALEATGPLLPGEPDLGLREWEEYYDRHALEHTYVVPGATDALAALLYRGWRLALVTNKPLAATWTVLRGTGLARWFPERASVLGGDSLPVRKPHPAMLHAALRAVRSAPTHAVLVGDSPVDVAAARAANVPVVAVSWGYARGEPRALDADALVERWRDVPDAVEQVWMPSTDPHVAE